MNNHLELPEDLRKEFKVDKEGKCTCTVRGASRLLGVDEKALRKHFQTTTKTADFLTSKLAQLLTGRGFEVADFPKKGIIDVALALIAEYYTLDAGARCTEEAKRIYRLFAAVGARSLIQQSLGWKKKEPRQFSAQEIQWLKIREEGVHDRKCATSAISRWLDKMNIQGQKRKLIYPQYTSLVYSQVTKLSSEQLMKRPLLVEGSEEDILRNRLSNSELFEVEMRERAFAKLMADREYTLDPLDAAHLVHVRLLALVG